MNAGDAVLFAVAVAAIALIMGSFGMTAGLVARSRDRQRLRRLRHWAETAGWRWDEDGPAPDWLDRVPYRDVWLGSACTGTVRTGDKEIPVTLADATHRTEAVADEKEPGLFHETTLPLVVLAARLPGQWPGIEVTRGDSWAAAVAPPEGWQQLRTDDLSFDAGHQVYADEPSAACLLSSELISWHLKKSLPLSAWSLHGGELLVSVEDRLDAATVETHLGTLRSLASALQAARATGQG